MIEIGSLYIAEDMKKSDLFNEKNLQVIRPGMGLALRSKI